MKFKVGDRVAVYGHRPNEIGTLSGFRYSRKDRGTVSDITSVDEICIDFDGGGSGEVHPKQCRLLKKKPLRRIWVPKYLLPKINKQTENYPYVTLESVGVREDYSYVGCVEFVEVRKAKKTGGGE